MEAGEKQIQIVLRCKKCKYEMCNTILSSSSQAHSILVLSQIKMLFWMVYVCGCTVCVWSMVISSCSSLRVRCTLYVLVWLYENWTVLHLQRIDFKRSWWLIAWHCKSSAHCSPTQSDAIVVIRATLQHHKILAKILLMMCKYCTVQVQYERTVLNKT